MKVESNKYISLFLIISLLLLHGNLFAKERKGAELIIQKTDRQKVRGELIAVKEKSLLLLERESGVDVTVDIGEIKEINIIKKSRALEGFLIGGMVGAMVGALSYSEPEGFTFLHFSQGVHLAFGAILLGLPGLFIGAVFGTDKEIQIEGKPEAEIQKILKDLRKKARIQDYN
jgi:hypothetical protein